LKKKKQQKNQKKLLKKKPQKNQKQKQKIKNKMKQNLINFKSTTKDTMEISDKIFAAEKNEKLIHSVIDWQLSKNKKRLAKTKQRNEIIGSTKKIYAQKGTGGARHGSRKAPIFVGGGKAHGPKGDAYKDRKMNKKVRKKGLIAALSSKYKNKEILVLNDVTEKVKKTKDFYTFMKKNNLMNCLFIFDQKTKTNTEISARNIANVKMLDTNSISVYDVIKYKNLVFSKTSVKELEKKLLQ